MSKIRFEILLLEEAEQFLSEIDPKAGRKLLAHLKRAQAHIEPKLFKKLDDVFWEFRVEYSRLQYRLLSFWDRRDGKLALVVATHGFIKKTDKVPGKEFERAYRIRSNYYAGKKE